MHKILIVEDDMVIAKAVADNIRTWDCEVRCVENFKDSNDRIYKLWA